MNAPVPFLWFDDQAEEAANFYISLFPNSRVLNLTRYGEGAPLPAGLVMTVEFELGGRPFVALNGGPHYSLTPAFSLSVLCETQEEVDRLWAALTEGGKEVACGWLTDRWGLSWQIVPEALPRLLQDPDPAKASRVMQAMMQMVKLDIAALERAADG